MGQPDLLTDMLEQARQEGALAGDQLEAFASALRERAHLIIEERLGALKTENAWLKTENAWRHEAMTGLEQRAQSLEQENTWRREAMEGLETRARALEAQGANATQAHEQLLAHHRQVLAVTVERLTSIAGLPLLRVSHGRRELRTLAELLRRETS